MAVSPDTFEMDQTVWVVVRDLVLLGRQKTMTSRHQTKLPFAVVETHVRYLKTGPNGIVAVFVNWWENDTFGGTLMVREIPVNHVHICLLYTSPSPRDS